MAVLVSWSLAVGTLGAGALSPPGAGAAATVDNVVLRWNTAALAAVRASTLAPPMVARALAIIHTCIYDTWAAYDPVAVGTRLGGSLRRPAGERTAANVDKAISFAAYRASVDMLPGSKVAVFDPLMATLGYDAADTSVDSSPAGVGNQACAAVLAFRHTDGANQLGDTNGGPPGVPYADYTGYAPVNDPMDLSRPFDPATVKDPNKWQPLRFTNAAGAVVTPQFIAPHWNRVTPFAMRGTAQARSLTGPATFGSPAYEAQAREILSLSAHLTDEQKMMSEYWSDGPRSETPPGHWNLLAQFVSHRDQQGVGSTAKMFFVLNNALLDASIVAWDNKVAYNSARPITAVRYLFAGQTVEAWGGPYQGTRLIDGAQWLPYQPSTFPTPPFGEYTSGHATFSGAAARVLRLFTGSDRFGHSVTLPAGSSRIEPGATPATPVTLAWPTFSSAAAQAGLSRRLGGIHFSQADGDGQANGATCGTQAFGKAWALFNGAKYPF